MELRYAQTHLALYARLLELGAGAEAILRVASAYELAVQLFANRFRPCGRPFVTHLVGTAAVVAEHGGDVDSTLAALLHAAYAQGEFGDAHSGASPTHRARVRAIVGASAEALIHAYDAATWPPSDLSALCARASSAALEDLERRVLLMRLANEVDDCRDLGPWVAGTQRKAAACRDLVAGVSLAEALGEAPLAELMRSLQESLNAARLPVALRMSREASFVVESLRLRERLRRALRARFARFGHFGSGIAKR